MANLVRTSKPISLIPILAFITIFLMVLNKVNSADSLSFSFNEFTADKEDLILQGTATTGSGGKNVLQLTNSEKSSVGRALYYAPVHLWKSSKLVSSFETTFSFVISTSDPTPGDGLAFFIASPDTTIPSNSAGKYLGLFPGPSSLKNSTSSTSHKKISINRDVKEGDASSAVVAVEFDTYSNTDIGDPNYKHVGIDINSITSKTTSAWDFEAGKTVSATISYDSVSKILSVVVSYPDSSLATLSYHTDLFTVLPEWVRVGFSASTGQQVQTNTILSWSFSSTLESDQIQKKDMHLATIV